MEQPEINSTFLNEFTKELIRNSAKYEIKLGPEKAKEELAEKEKEKVAKPAPVYQPAGYKPSAISAIAAIPMQAEKGIVKPMAVEILPEEEFPKIQHFIDSREIFAVECSGPDSPLAIRTKFGVQQTNIRLSGGEINSLLKKFSEKARIPLEEGMFKIQYENVQLFAIYSELIGSKFIIKKSS